MIFIFHQTGLLAVWDPYWKQKKNLARCENSDTNEESSLQMEKNGDEGDLKYFKILSWKGELII